MRTLTPKAPHVQLVVQKTGMDSHTLATLMVWNAAYAGCLGAVKFSTACICWQVFPSFVNHLSVHSDPPTFHMLKIAWIWETNHRRWEFSIVFRIISCFLTADLFFRTVLTCRVLCTYWWIISIYGRTSRARDYLRCTDESHVLIYYAPVFRVRRFGF